MPAVTKNTSFYADTRNPQPKTFHIETDGAMVNITVGLTDSEGRAVTRVDVSPDDETRGGDAEGRIWIQDGPRVIRQHKPERAGS